MEQIKGRKMKKFLVLFALIFVGCNDRNDPKIVSINENTLLGNGEYVGKLSNGNVVRRYEINMGDKSNHFVYIIDNNPAVTMNQSVSNGDTSVNETNVVIDGTRYYPGEKVVK
jgi:hypothetical protein